MWRPVYTALYPLMVAFNSIPKVAIVPIFMLWFGIGLVTSTLTAFVLCFFPIVVNMAVAMATIEPELKDVLRALGANERDIVFKIGIPRSLPYLFAALKIAITLAFVGAVIAETVAGGSGIGTPDAGCQLQLQHTADVRRADRNRGDGRRHVCSLRRPGPTVHGGWATRDNMSYATAGG